MTSGSSYVAFILMKKTHSGTSMLMNHWIIGGANHIPSRGQGSYQRSLNDRKGRQAIASVLCKLCPTRARGQLHPHGKIGISLSQRKQTAKKGITRPRTSIKGQILADFIVERPDEESPDELMMVLWRAVWTNLEGVEFTYAMRFRFEATNNEVEYEALIAGLRIAEQMGVKNLQANLTLLVSKTRKSFRKTKRKPGWYVARHPGTPLSMELYTRNLSWDRGSGALDLFKQTTSLEKYTKDPVHHPIPRNPQQNLTPITSPWPFYKWGIDIAGPFPEGPGKVKFLIVAIDYFTKWIEAKPVATITGNQVKKFVWDNIVCSTHKQMAWSKGQTGVWERESKLDWIKEARIDRRYSYTLGHTITMIKSSNGETPFSLTYGTEAVIPAEIGMPTLWTVELDLTKNDEALGINLDLIEEKREQAAIQEAKSKAKMEKYYNSKVQSTSFRPGEMVYRGNDASHAKDGGKLGPKWEGPYKVTESLGKGAYKLKDQKGNELP
ncbi:reverse transcriptase domain-containing protein [Tanacetum coccineum]